MVKTNEISDRETNRWPFMLEGVHVRRFLGPETLYFLFAWLANTLVFRSRGFADPGTFWHIRVGELIFQQGMMRTDPFTFTFQGETWIPQQWAAECIMAMLHALGGFETLLLAFSLGVAGLFTWIFRCLRESGMTVPLAATVATFAMVAAGFHFYIRPHLWTIGLLAIVMRWLVKFERGEWTVLQLVWLIPLHAVWTNLHGGMLAGLFSIGFVLSGWTVSLIFGGAGAARTGRSLLRLWLVLLACGATMLLNPIGLELQRTWFRIVGSDTMKKYVTEHQALNLSREGDQVLLMFGIIYLVLLLSVPIRSWRVTWLLPIAWFLLTLQSIRHGPLFVVTGVIALADFFSETAIYNWLARQGDSLVRSRSKLSRLQLVNFLLPAFVAIVSFGLQATRTPFPVLGSGWVRFNSPTVPVDLIQPLQQIAESSPPGTRIFNSINFGGYVIYFAPSLKIFADDRFELCGDKWLAKYVDIVTHHPERFDEWQHQYGFRWALVASEPNRLPLEEYLFRSSNWVLVAQGRTAAIYRLKSE